MLGGETVELTHVVAAVGNELGASPGEIFQDLAEATLLLLAAKYAWWFMHVVAEKFLSGQAYLERQASWLAQTGRAVFYRMLLRLLRYLERKCRPRR
jgi:hypothetical protein